MKKMIIALTCVVYFTTVNAQLSERDFNAEFSKIVENEKKIRPIIKEFTDKFTLDEIQILHSENNSSILLGKNPVLLDRIVELKKMLQETYRSNVTLITKLYGTLSNLNMVDLNLRINRFFEMTVNPQCIGCLGACWSSYYECLASGYIAFCQSWHQQCVASCPCAN